MFIYFFSIVFFLGFLGFCINKLHIIISIICVEIIIISACINFLCCSILFCDLKGEIFVLSALTIAACEVIVGLSLLVVYYNTNSSIKFNKKNLTIS